jgi:hypothetical protein
MCAVITRRDRDVLADKRRVGVLRGTRLVSDAEVRMVQFDAALAFVMLLLLLSLVVTALVQAAIAVFDVRGGNLTSAIITILEQAGLSEKAKALAGQVVMHPALKGAFRHSRVKAVKREELRALLGALGVGDEPLKKVDLWFDPVMDRSSDWFVAKTRAWTVALSFALAWGLGVDAIDTYGRLLRDPGLRSSLIASADAVTRQAEQTLEGAPVRLAAERVGAAGAEAEVVRRMPTDLLSCRQAEGWLASAQPSPPKAVREEFRKACEEERLRMLTGAAASVTGLSQQLQEGGVDLSWVWSKPDRLDGRKIIGILLTCILLSLGAPFWFNALRQMAALRPVIAQKVSPQS